MDIRAPVPVCLPVGLSAAGCGGAAAAGSAAAVTDTAKQHPARAVRGEAPSRLPSAARSLTERPRAAPPPHSLPSPGQRLLRAHHQGLQLQLLAPVHVRAADSSHPKLASDDPECRVVLYPFRCHAAAAAAVAPASGCCRGLLHAASTWGLALVGSRGAGNAPTTSTAPPCPACSYPEGGVTSGDTLFGAIGKGCQCLDAQYTLEGMGGAPSSAPSPAP